MVMGDGEDDAEGMKTTHPEEKDGKGGEVSAGEEKNNTNSNDERVFSDMWLCTRTAHEILSLLRDARVTPEELLSVVSRRIQNVNGHVHAVITTCFNRARTKLREVKEQMRSFRARGVPLPPGYLYGMPLLIKDTNYVRGVRFTMGFYTEDEDEENVKRREFTDSDPLVLQVDCAHTHLPPTHARVRVHK